MFYANDPPRAQRLISKVKYIHLNQTDLGQEHLHNSAHNKNTHKWEKKVTAPKCICSIMCIILIKAFWL